VHKQQGVRVNSGDKMETAPSMEVAGLEFEHKSDVRKSDGLARLGELDQVT
jgi:hypothetical protein